MWMLRDEQPMCLTSTHSCITGTDGTQEDKHTIFHWNKNYILEQVVLTCLIPESPSDRDLSSTYNCCIIIWRDSNRWFCCRVSTSSTTSASLIASAESKMVHRLMSTRSTCHVQSEGLVRWASNGHNAHLPCCKVWGWLDQPIMGKTSTCHVGNRRWVRSTSNGHSKHSCQHIMSTMSTMSTCHGWKGMEV